MALPIQIGVKTRQGGTWVRAEPSVKVLGVWTPVHTVWTRVAGTWVRCHVDAAQEVNITNQNISAFDSSGSFPVSVSRYVLQTDGVARAERVPGTSNDISNQWKKYELGRDFEAKWTVVSSTGGIFVTPFSAGVWTALSSDRTWQLTNSDEENSYTRVFDVELREAAGTIVLDTARISLTCQNLP